LGKTPPAGDLVIYEIYGAISVCRRAISTGVGGGGSGASPKVLI